MWNRDRMTAAVIAGLLSSSVLASIKVEFKTTGSFTDITSAVTISGTNVTINSPSSGTYRISRTDAGNLGVVTFASANKTINLLLSTSAEDFNDAGAIPSSGCTNWGGLVPGQTNQVSVQATIEGNLTSAVSAYHIYRIDAFGAINANVSQSSTSPSAVLYAIKAGADSAPNQAITSTISSAGGEIRLVSCTGDFTGSITADSPGARITSLEVQGNLTGDATKVIYAEDGTIGRINVSGYIEYTLRSLGAPNIWCRYGIDSIEADSIKLAKISAEFNGNINDPNQLHNDGRIKYLTTHTGECNAIIQASTIGASSEEFGVFIAGDLKRELGYNNAGNYETNGTWLTITKPIYVGGSVNVASGAAMTIDCGFNSIMYIDQSLYDDLHFRNACGLAGQIIINAANNSGTWASGDIVFYGRKSDSTWPETQRL